MTEISIHNQELFELYHRISQNESELSNIISIKDDNNNNIELTELDIELLEKIEWEPNDVGIYKLDINNNTHIVEVINNLPNSTIAHWKFYDSNTYVNDSIGNTDIDFSSINWNSNDKGLNEEYAVFNGSSNYGTVLNSETELSFPIKTGKITLAGWFYPIGNGIGGSGSRAALLGNGYTRDSNNWTAMVEDNKLRWDMGVDGEQFFRYKSNSEFESNKWQPFAFQADGSKGIIRQGLKMENDGEVSFDSDLLQDVNLDSKLFLGVDSGGKDESPLSNRYYEGYMDNIWISTEYIKKEKLKEWVNATKSYYM